MPCTREQVTLGSSGLRVSPIGVASSYGIGGSDLERAFEQGINLFFWGLRRTERFGSGLRTIARGHRDEVVVAIQSYSRMASLIGRSVESALRRLEIDHADLLVLGMWNSPPPERILEAALRLREAGRVRHLGISCHDRPTFQAYARDPRYSILMIRYNAAHRGAEREVFPFLAGERPGVLAFTATRWGSLMDPSFTAPGEATPRASDCYRFVLSSPHVNACLAGPRDGAELDEALAALDRGPMTDEEMAWMHRIGDLVHAGGGVGLAKRALRALSGSAR